MHSIYDKNIIQKSRIKNEIIFKLAGLSVKITF